jgi:eukaryotic-like serine/threonine-protein kinase
VSRSQRPSRSTGPSRSGRSSRSADSASVPVGAQKPFEAALSGELRAFEQVTVRAWQAFWSVALFGSLVAAATFSDRLGFACAGVSAALLAAHVLLGRRLRKRAGRATLRGWLLAIETASPWLLLLVLLVAAGADYALSSWVPPVMFCLLVVAFAARLQPRAALLTGLASGVVYPLLYVALVAPRLSSDAAAQITYQLPMQLFRAASLVAGGVLGMLAARGLRAAFERADIAAREQDLFGKYRLLRQVDAGGMGVVYEASYEPEGGFARRVALKRVHQHLADQPRFVDAFRAEAELCARLVHPNIVQVVDFGRVGTSYFLAMEYVDGLALGTFARRAREAALPLPPHVVGLVARELLSALAHAHEGARDANGRTLRVVHRDVCPQNVLVSRNGEVKLTDFGVARALRDAEATHTRAAGHVAYMAPEQARGEPVDRRVDLFAVGAVIWELLGGRRLFARDNEPATLIALLSEPVPLVTALREDVDRGWDIVLVRALAREASARFGSATEMLAALDAVPDATGERAAEDLAALVERLIGAPESSAPRDAETITDDSASPIAARARR